MVNPSFPMLDWLLHKLAIDTWENLQAAKRLEVRFGEETITDLLMFELRRRGFITFKQTSLADEPDWGTDFECWIGWAGRSWTGYAVQAKKLKHNTKPRGWDSYNTFYQNVGNTQNAQIDILKAYAKLRDISPRYCLYNHSLEVQPSMLSCCIRQFPEEELGCTITSTKTVKQAKYVFRGRSFQAIQQQEATVPWRCLALCPAVRYSLYRGSSRSFNDISPLITEETIFHPELPDGINSLLEQSEETVDFQEYGVGVDPREMGMGDYVPDGLLVPKRLFILDLSGSLQPQQNLSTS